MTSSRSGTPVSSIVVMFLAIVSNTTHAIGQVVVDTDSETVRKAAGDTHLDDLSVNDTAVLYSGPFCVGEDNRLYIPGWTRPADLAAGSYDMTGIVVRVTVLPGKRLKATFVDGAQAQKVARGNSAAPSLLSKAEYNKEVLRAINGIFWGGFFSDPANCNTLSELNPLQTLNLFSVDSLNGFNTISELLKSVMNRQ